MGSKTEHTSPNALAEFRISRHRWWLSSIEIIYTAKYYHCHKMDENNWSWSDFLNGEISVELSNLTATNGNVPLSSVFNISRASNTWSSSLTFCDFQMKEIFFLSFSPCLRNQTLLAFTSIYWNSKYRHKTCTTNSDARENQMKILNYIRDLVLGVFIIT